MKVALTLILAGALGNQIDRIVRGYVVDFLDFYVGDAHWPFFNVGRFLHHHRRLPAARHPLQEETRMHPILVKIGPLTVHTYGFMMAVGVALGLWFLYAQAKKRGLDANRSWTPPSTPSSSRSSAPSSSCSSATSPIT